MQKLIRITTIPDSIQSLLRGQLRFMEQYYEVVAVSSRGERFEKMLREQGALAVAYGKIV